MTLWRKRRGVGQTFTLLLAALAAVANGSQHTPVLIKVETANPGEVRALLAMDLDLWEVRDRNVVALVTPDELTELAQHGFASEILDWNMYELLEPPGTREVAIAADPNRTEGRYHSYEEIVQSLYELPPSGVARVEVIGNTIEGRDIVAVKISDNPEVDEDEPELLFVGCHHAREWVSAEVPLYLARYLIEEYTMASDITRWVNGCETWIVPVVNPDGLEYSRTTDRLWRKNRRDNEDGTFGVDLSRNYDYMWGQEGSSADGSSPYYRGTHAFSEPETQAVRDLVLRSEFRTFVTYHSYAQKVIYPWGYTSLAAPDDCLLSTMATDIAALLHFMNKREYTPLRLGQWYLVSGDESDWVYGACGIPSFAIELPPTTPEQGGFLLPASQIIPTCEENIPPALYLLAWATGYGTVENLTTGRQFDHIQSAVCDAMDGDEIVVHEGVYPEHIDFRGKSLTLRSTDPEDPNVVTATTIAGCHAAPVVTFSCHEDETSVLSGLTISGDSVGVYCRAASPSILNCTIASEGSAAVETWDGYEPCEPHLVDCTILGRIERHDPRIAHWKLNETEGTTAVDSVAANNAHLLGDPIWRPHSGQIDGAIELDGVDDGAEAGFVFDPGVVPYSIFAWVRGGRPGQAILSQDYGDNWLMTDRIAGHLMTELETCTAAFGLYSQTSITDGDWHHVGLVWDESGTRSLYVDAVEVARETGVYPWPWRRTDGGVRIGAPGWLYSPTFFCGLIDDVRIYNRAVTP
jgi:murein tripeptide amidase MpaA